MAEYEDLWEMDPLWLMMEFKRLTVLESTGETDDNVSYKASDLEEQIMHRLKEYQIDRF